MKYDVHFYSYVASKVSKYVSRTIFIMTRLLRSKILLKRIPCSSGNIRQVIPFFCGPFNENTIRFNWITSTAIS